MTDHARAIEAGARAIFNASTYQGYTREFLESEWARCKSIEMAKAKACIEAAIASGALVPASAGQRVPLDWGKLVQCVLRCMDATIKNESSREQAERIATAIEERFGTVPASAVEAERERCAKWHDEQAAEQAKFRAEFDRHSEIYEERKAWRNRKDKEDFHRFCAASLRALSPEPASGEFVVVPRADLQVVVDIAGRNESAIEIECIKEWLKDAATKDGERG